MKKKLLILAVAILCLSCFFVISMSATEESTPTLEVTYTNLSFKDTVYIKYAVAAENVTPEDVRMYVFTEPQSNYKDTSKATVLLPQYLDEIEGEEYIIFDYTNLSAKQMTDVVYAYAAVEVDGTTYYSNLRKYSILRYAFDMRTNPEATDDLNTMLADMLTYGNSAQKYFDYKANRPANGDWYDIRVVGGTHADGFAYGLHMAGDELTLIPAEAPADKVFSHWENVAGEPQTLPITAPAQNEAYTAVYKDEVTYSQGLEFTLNEGGESYSVSDIGECTDTEIIIPKTYEGLPVTAIGEDAFRDCDTITSITIPDGVTTIESCAFYWCTALTEINIPDSVTVIDDAFSYCFSLTSIDLPDQLTKIAPSAFSFCAYLAGVEIPASVTSIGAGAFYGCSSIESMTVAADNTTYYSAGNCIIEKATGTLIAGCKNSVIPADGSVTSIANAAFRQNMLLESIVIPASVTSIGEYAFYGCEVLASVTFGENSQLTSIGRFAFCCPALSDIEIPADVTSIGASAFSGCAALASVTFGNPNGWSAVDVYDPSITTALVLSDLEQNATYLTTTYSGYLWKRQ